MSNHQNIEELFRSKLGEAEITPSRGAWKGVQRQLRMKKFLRFDAGSFNAWYAGALLVAGATAVVLFGTNQPESQAEAEHIAPVIEEIRESNTEGLSREELKEEKKEEKRAAVREDTKRELSESTKENKLREGRKGKDTETAEKAAPEKAAPQEQSPGTEVQEEPEALVDDVADSALNIHGPVAHFTASESMGCAPLRVEFRSSSVYASSLSWNFGNGTFSQERDPVYTFENAGIYAVALSAYGTSGDSAVYYEVIRVYPAPVAGFEIGEGIQQADGSLSMELMNYSTGAFSYSWQMLSEAQTKVGDWSSNEYQPTFSNSDIPEEAGLIGLVALNEHGCTDTAFAEIRDLSTELHNITFPTVFSGNSTGPNGGYYTPNDLRLDIFHPHFSEEPADYLLRVYSKTGEVIFETRDILQGWDGYYMQAAAASGVYLWVATGTWHNGGTFNLRGDVTLLWDRR